MSNNSNDNTDQVTDSQAKLKQVLGPMFGFVWPLVRRVIATVKIKFDVEKKVLRITQGDNVQEITFDDIERTINSDQL